MSTTYNVALLVISVVVVFQTLLIFYLARYIGEFISKIESIEGVRIGSIQEGQHVPSFREVDGNGRKVVSKEVFNQRSLLLFVNSNCATCKEVVPEITRVLNTYKLEMIVVNTDELHDDSDITRYLNDRVHYIRSSKLQQAYSITKVPFAYMIEDNLVEVSIELKGKASLWNMLINEERIAS
ncbi:thioredoxin-like domain-containing protein [Rossellomorea marisflavi]|uniref:TlpA family protein disulfide reductase n=1 Tax=Rossellomorea marisflavi TaxID=189381 RepID=UPI0034583C42